MPYKSEVSGLKIPKKLDKRIKLKDDDIKRMRYLYNVEGWSIRKIAKQYENLFTRKTVRAGLFGWAAVKSKDKPDWKHYYNREKHAEYMRKYRSRKKILFDDKKLEGQ